MSPPLFIGDWESLGMVHLAIAPRELQPAVPFELDLFEGSAFVSLVFFTMRNMRLARAPALLNGLFHPFRQQRFLNVRTYVRHRGESGIHFITEWISNPLSVYVGPLLYSLPLRSGTHDFTFAEDRFLARVTDSRSKTSLACDFRFNEPFRPCQPGSRDEFLFERYAAFNSHGRTPKSFQVSHAPWEQCAAEPVILDDSLLQTHFPWFRHARVAGANYSPGVRDVLMSRPRRMATPACRALPHLSGKKVTTLHLQFS